MRTIDAPSTRAADIPALADPCPEFEMWRTGVRRAALAHVSEFVETRCVPQLRQTGIDIAPDVLIGLLDGGKCLRSMFMYLGWLCGGESDPDADTAALRAAAGLDLLHAFALLQDDVMDDSPLRRGRPAAHVRFAGWHRDNRLSGPSDRFGASLAILLSDLCLVWAEQIMRESGVGTEELTRAWPHYDAMRIELAVGQIADVANDAGAMPTLDAVLDVARRKSGNYTVRRPLEIGAAMAGRADLLGALGGYGSLVGEAFQLRDDMLGVFGAPEATGKPAGGDLAERKATSVVVTAQRLADGPTRQQFAALMAADRLDEDDIARWRSLIVATGAVEEIEDMIARRVSGALDHIASAPIDGAMRTALTRMAAVCTQRTT